MKKLLSIVPYLVIAVLVGVTVASAGSLTPPGSVANTMYSLTDIFNLSAGTTTTVGSGAIGATPGSIAATGKTLTEVYDAIAGEVDNLSAGVIASGTSAFGITGTLVAGGGLPKTGQTTCFNAAGGSIACAGTGQDGQYQEGNPSSGAHFTDNGDNTITDNATGLMWKKCSEGQSGATCATGSATGMNWTTALTTCEADTTASNSDWRLPNRFELDSITDIRGYGPAIDTTFFPGTIDNTSYWSSSWGYNESSAVQDVSWYVNYSYGFTRVTEKTNATLKTRCVRG